MDDSIYYTTGDTDSESLIKNVSDLDNKDAGQVNDHGAYLDSGGW